MIREQSRPRGYGRKIDPRQSKHVETVSTPQTPDDLLGRRILYKHHSYLRDKLSPIQIEYGGSHKPPVLNNLLHILQDFHKELHIVHLPLPSNNRRHVISRHDSASDALKTPEHDLCPSGTVSFDWTQGIQDVRAIDPGKRMDFKDVIRIGHLDQR